MQSWRYKVVVSYDGSNYHGSQIQQQLPTIQLSLQQALKKMFHIDLVITLASRTDQGVHALYQVFHVDLPFKLETHLIINGLNQRLTGDIIIINASIVSSEFHARFSAKAKTYQYTITKVPSTIINQRFEVYQPNLNIELIRQVLPDLIGTHDFIAFGKYQAGKPTVKTIHAINLKETKHRLIFTIKGDNFLRYMVRTMIGNLIAVGLHQKPITQLKDLLLTGDRKLSAKLAPAKGLVLKKIYY
jgi:tRNA pseudouridine38-40 synthase